jgi:chorismate-pyruvate lyase
MIKSSTGLIHEFVFSKVENPFLRLLLLSDGSTTLNLQCLVASDELELTILEQKEANENYEHHSIGSGIYRKTKFSYQGNDISYNFVLFDKSQLNSELLHELEYGGLPLGLIIKKLALPIERKLISCNILPYSEVTKVFPNIYEIKEYYHKQYAMKINKKVLCIVDEYFLIDEEFLLKWCVNTR